MNICLEQPQHAAAIDAILDTTFGPDRFAKTAYRLRDGVEPLAELCFVALNERDEVEGTIRYWPVTIGNRVPTLLLGPIAVQPDRQGGGLGAALIRYSLNRAGAAGHKSVILVGDEPYYRRFGFVRDLTLGMTLPGPVDLNRFLGLELVPGALAGVTGAVLPLGRPLAASGLPGLDFLALAERRPA